MSTMASQFTLKSPASRLFSQPFVQAQIKENTKIPLDWPLCVCVCGGGGGGGGGGGIHRWPVAPARKGQ